MQIAVSSTLFRWRGLDETNLLTALAFALIAIAFLLRVHNFESKSPLMGSGSGAREFSLDISATWR